MRAVLANFGSTGSIYPYVALAVELRRHGHAPVLALPPSFSGVAARHGIEFRPIGPDQLDAQMLINESMGDVPDDPADIRNQLAPLAASLPRMFAELTEACAGADVLLCGPVQPAGLMVHETTGIPYVSVQNVHYASGGTRAFQTGLAESINGVRRDVGLAALHDPMMQANDAAVLVLFAMSRHVRARPSAWPPHYHLTGYFFLDDPWTPDPDLDAFLRDGSRPIAVTFGSMSGIL